MSFIAAGALVGGGMLAGGAASFLGAASSNRAARQAQTTSRSDAAQEQRQLGFLQLGPDDYMDLLRATGSRSDLIFAGLPGTVSPQQRSEAAARFFGKYPTLSQVQDQAGSQYLSDLNQNVAQEHGTTQRLDALATQNEQAGQDMLGQEIARIQRDSGRSLTNLNRSSTASLSMLGVNSLGANQVAANTRLSGENEDNSILGAKTAALDRFQNARQQRIGLMTGRSALEGELGRSVAGAKYNTAMAGPQSRLSLFGQPQFAALPPMSGPGQSPAGSALGTIGSGLTTLGGLLAMRGTGGGGGGSGGSAMGAYNGPSNSIGGYSGFNVSNYGNPNAMRFA